MSNCRVSTCYLLKSYYVGLTKLCRHVWYSSVLRRRRKIVSDGHVACCGRLFQTRTPATGKEQSPIVECTVFSTTSAVVAAERSHWRTLTRDFVAVHCHHDDRNYRCVCHLKEMWLNRMNHIVSFIWFAFYAVRCRVTRNRRLRLITEPSIELCWLIYQLVISYFQMCTYLLTDLAYSHPC